MPLIVKDFTWEQTEKVLFVTVPLKGVKASKVDIFSSEEYLKVCLESTCEYVSVPLSLIIAALETEVFIVSYITWTKCLDYSRHLGSVSLLTLSPS